MAIADRYHVLPHVVETQVDERWLNHIATLMEAEGIDRRRQDNEMKKSRR